MPFRDLVRTSCGAGDWSQALNQHLRRRKIWMALREAAEHEGELLTSYSLRHRCAKGMRSVNLPFANIRDAVGHTIKRCI